MMPRIPLPASQALISPHLHSRNFVAFLSETFYKKLSMQILHFVVNQKCARKPNFYLGQNVYNCVFDPISLLRPYRKFICKSKSKKKINIFAAFKMSFFQEVGQKLSLWVTISLKYFNFFVRNTEYSCLTIQSEKIYRHA